MKKAVSAILLIVVLCNFICSSKSYAADFDGLKSNTGNKIQKSKEKRAENKARKEKAKAEKEVQKQLEVKAEPYTKTKVKTDNPTEIIQPLDFEDQSLFDPVNIKRHWKNRLYGDYDPARPQLRDYDKL